MNGTMEIDAARTNDTTDAQADRVLSEAMDATVEECRCLACESLIPANAIRVQPIKGSDDGRPRRARLVHLYCEHCNLTYELVQTASNYGWRNAAMSTLSDRAATARVARAMAGGQRITYVDQPATPSDPDAARRGLVAMLDQEIAFHEASLSAIRERRAHLMGAAHQPTTVVGGASSGSFPFVSGDMRHLMDERNVEHWEQM